MPPRAARTRSPYLLGILVSFHLPACITDAKSILRASRSCAAPTRAEWPDIFSHSSLSSPIHCLNAGSPRESSSRSRTWVVGFAENRMPPEQPCRGGNPQVAGATDGTNAHGESDRIGNDRNHDASSGHVHNNKAHNKPVRAPTDRLPQQPEHRCPRSDRGVLLLTRWHPHPQPQERR